MPRIREANYRIYSDVNNEFEMDKTLKLRIGNSGNERQICRHST